jgi:hypothetical protein
LFKKSKVKKEMKTVDDFVKETEFLFRKDDPDVEKRETHKLWDKANKIFNDEEKKEFSKKITELEEKMMKEGKRMAKLSHINRGPVKTSHLTPAENIEFNKEYTRLQTVRGRKYVYDTYKKYIDFFNTKNNKKLKTLSMDQLYTLSGLPYNDDTRKKYKTKDSVLKILDNVDLSDFLVNLKQHFHEASQHSWATDLLPDLISELEALDKDYI